MLKLSAVTSLWYGASVSHSHPPVAGTHCTYPQRDDQAELIWVTDLHSTDSHPSKDWPDQT